MTIEDYIELLKGATISNDAIADPTTAKVIAVSILVLGLLASGVYMYFHTKTKKKNSYKKISIGLLVLTIVASSVSGVIYKKQMGEVAHADNQTVETAIAAMKERITETEYNFTAESFMIYNDGGALQEAVSIEDVDDSNVRTYILKGKLSGDDRGSYLLIHRDSTGAKDAAQRLRASDPQGRYFSLLVEENPKDMVRLEAMKLNVTELPDGLVLEPTNLTVTNLEQISKVIEATFQ